MADIRISSCCKINLFLQVTGRRSDGYHTLSTLFLPVRGVEDEIICDFSAQAGIEVKSLDPDIPSGKDNLIYRAAERYAQVSGVTPEWSFILDKKVPVAAGLGGGSSNAAAVLQALNTCYRKLDSVQLHKLASGIGADVPFFLESVPAWAEGIGDELVPVKEKYPVLYLVLANPGFPVGVRWSYGKLDASKFAPADIEAKEKLTRALVSGNTDGISALCRNDLGDALFVKFPLLQMMRRSMLDAGAGCVQVSGSGPTLFAVCRSKEVQRQVAERMRKDFQNNSGIRIFECEA